MRKMILALAAVLCLNVLSHAAEAIPVNAPLQTEQTETNSAPAMNAMADQDDFSDEASEEAKKKRRKKKKKNPVVKWIVGGAITVAALVLYVATDGEGWHSR